MEKKIILIPVLFLIGIILAQAIEQSLPGDDPNLEKSLISEKRVTELYYYDHGMGSPIVKIASMKYEPYPVEPGSKFDLWLRVDNLGREKAENVRVEFVSNNLFSIHGDLVKTIGELGSRQSAVVKFENIKVSDNAAEGENTLKFKINMGGAYDLSTLTSGLTIEVRSIQPLFEITVSSEPEKIPQGGVAEITINLKNEDKALLRNIDVELDLPDELTPVGSTVLKRIQEILPGEEKSVIYKITASGDATAKAYQIPLIVRYFDESGENYTKSDAMGLLVGIDPDYYINLEESDTFSKGTKGKIVLSVSNTGPSDIKFLTLELLPSEDFVITSNTKTYVGNLEPDDYETAEFEIYAKKSGDIPLNVQVEYRDNYNMKQVTTHSVNLHSYSSLELRRYGLVTGYSPVTRLICYVLVIIFLYLTYKNWRKERDIVKAGKKSLAAIIVGFFKLLGMLRWKNLKTIPARIRNFLSS